MTPGWGAVPYLAAAGLIVAGAAMSHAGLFQAAEPGWREVAWPFARDAWPAGRAFRCAAAACGGEVDVYVRPKLGFCNCSTGVAGDDEVDGVSDMDMLSADFTPRGAGLPVVIGGMAGRTRAYTLHMPGGRQQSAAGFAVSRRCDLVVAASQGPGAGSPEARRAIAELLGTGQVMTWLTSLLGRS